LSQFYLYQLKPMLETVGMGEMGGIASLEGVVMGAMAVMEPQVAVKGVVVARDFC
jgi:hypothetical protein